MQIETYVQAVSDDLARVAAVGDESTARAAELLAIALESALTRRLQEALAEAALELSSQLDHGRVELRVAGDDTELVYVGEAEHVPSEAAAEEANAARITLRLPESLKSRVEGAAASNGVSVNTWLVQAASRQLESRPRAGASWRLTGYGQS
jgi:predicted DNA binding CopG/RHH family protein